ncbi:MAG: PTS glucose transporter subunit IIA [Actinomycetia bacterium]|nr:PTS glucose transporter subunit IIA [Actinomycetes bacterium]MCH9702235.1 PTS glucose transporter subunit IIA [Actinomycetes bacterium]MCH9760974.1 PTS glucose transporter subunit IIA [Actinomycetes bacterium]
MGGTRVLAAVTGRALPLSEVPDPVFSQGIVGYGAAIDPPREVVGAVAPVSGTLLTLLAHAYVIMTAETVGVLVHLGLDTVGLNGAGFTAHVSQGDTVDAGQVIITYDVPAIIAAGLSPVVPVVAMDERDSQNIAVSDAVRAGADITPHETLFTVGR